VKFPTVHPRTVEFALEPADQPAKMSDRASLVGPADAGTVVVIAF